MTSLFFQPFFKNPFLQILFNKILFTELKQIYMHTKFFEFF